MATEIKKLDGKTFLFNGEAKPIGYKCVAVGDLVTLDSGDLITGSLFHNTPYTVIIVKDTDGSVIVDGSAVNKKANDVVQAINNIVNFSGGGGVGALAIAKKTDGKDAVFADLAALKLYYTTNEKPRTTEAAVIGTADASGNALTISIAYVWNPTNNKWEAVATNFKGEKGSPGDVSLLIDDNAAHADKTYSSNKLVNELEALTKKYGDDGRVRLDATTKHFYFEVKQPDGTWLSKFEIGGSAYVDVLNLLNTTPPTNVRPGSLSLYSKDVPIGGGATIESPHIKTSKGEYSFVVTNKMNDKVLFRKTNGELIHIPVEYLDEADATYTNLKRIKFIGNLAVSKLPDDSLIVDVNGKDVINIPSNLAMTTSNYLTYNNRILAASQSGTAMQTIVLPPITSIGAKSSFIINNSRGLGRLVSLIPNIADSIGGGNQLLLNRGDTIFLEKPAVGNTWIIVSHYRGPFSSAVTPEIIIRELGVPQGDERLDASTVKDIAGELNRELGTTAWQNGGGGTHPGTPFNAYSGFFHGDVITEQEIARLKKEILHNPVHTFYGTNSNPPSYFYICIPTVDAADIGYVAQSPSSLGTIWVKTEVSADLVPYTVLRSPNRMYDSAPSFKVLAK